MQLAFVGSPALGRGDSTVGSISDTSRVQTRTHSRFPSRGQPQGRGQARGPGPSRSRSSPMMLAAGEVVRGKVSGVAKFGAFIELQGGVQGLVHISELSQGFVRDILDVVQIGDEVSVLVLSVDQATGRIALSMKQCDPPGSRGYDRVVELGGDWGHPWGDDKDTKFMDLGPRPPSRSQHWQPDLEKFRPFDEAPPTPSSSNSE
eukprot:IDg16377t1